MQDDFGDFLQAVPATNALSGKPRMQSSSKPVKDLNTKIMESFSLTGTSQRAPMQFKQVPRPAGKKPQSMQYKPSSSAADWSHLDVKTSDFTLPSNYHQSKKQHQLTQPNLQPNYYMQQHAEVPRQPAPYLQGNVNQYRGHMPMDYSRMQMNYQIPYRQTQINKNMPRPQSTMIGSQPNVFPNQQRPAIVPDSVNRIQNVPTVQPSKIINNNPVGTLPTWMTKPNEIPNMYKKVLKRCATPNSFADTSRLYPILVSSQLPKDVLGHIWSAANQSTPGQLTFTEVYIALALIGLAQTGDMNLSVQHATSLKVPPVPNLQFNFASSQPSSTSTQMEPTIPNQSKEIPLISDKYDSFREFQSVSPHTDKQPLSYPSALSFSSPAAPASQNELSKNVSSGRRLPSSDFDDFQSFNSNTESSIDSKSLKSAIVPSSNSDFGEFCYAPSVIQSFPDRNLINSPNSQSLENLQHSSLPRSPVSFESDLYSSKPVSSQYEPSSIQKSNSSKSLPLMSEMKDVGLSASATVLPILSNDNEFGEFKMSNTTSHIKIPIIGSLSKPNKQDPSTVAHPLPVFPRNDLMASTDPSDKYSALRDLFPNIDNVGEKETNNEYSDFQTCTHIQEECQDIFGSTAENGNVSSASTITSVSNVTQSNSLNNFSISFENDFPLKKVKTSLSATEKLGWNAEESSSVKSLELPSLSKTISNLSIGSSSPLKASDSFTVLSNQEAKTNNDDDQLYSLDEPISPPSVPKNFHVSTKESGFSNDFGNFTSASAKTVHKPDQLYDLTKPASPVAGLKRSKVLRKISEAESDFGDFSAAPPPIDDTSDHYNEEFDMYQAGNSSLVDFDAFDHFEESRLEKKKDGVKTGIQKKKEETTAFSELMKSSVENMTNTPQVNGASNISNISNVADSHDDDDWSGFNTAKSTNGRYSTEQTATDDHIVEVVNEKTDEVYGINDFNEKNTGPRYTNNPENNNFDDFRISENFEETSLRIQPEWEEEEGEELKARMDGTTNSDPMELYSDHWGRCLSTCKDIIQSTGEIFGELNSPAVCHEIVNSSRGKEFISCTSEVYGVARRIRRGMESVHLQDIDLKQTLKDIEIAWNNLLGFCPYTPSVHKTPEHYCGPPAPGLSGESQDSRKNSACSLCLLSTDGNSPVGLAYGGKYYHAPCANLWLNQVAPMLPRLVPPTT